MSEIDSREFRTVLGHFPTGVTVVTSVDEGEPIGLAVGSFTSLSLDPALVAFMVDKGSSSWPRIEHSGRFCVNVLAEDQADLCTQFAKPGDKFAGVEWSESGLGSPVLAHALAMIDCTLSDALEGGDHWIAIGEVAELQVARDDVGPLVFFQGRYGAFQAI